MPAEPIKNKNAFIQMQNLPEESVCIICLEDFPEKDAVTHPGGNGHQFHPLCIDTWINGSAISMTPRRTSLTSDGEATCPGCRHVLHDWSDGTTIKMERVILPSLGYEISFLFNNLTTEDVYPAPQFATGNNVAGFTGTAWPRSRVEIARETVTTQPQRLVGQWRVQRNTNVLGNLPPNTTNNTVDGDHDEEFGFFGPILHAAQVHLNDEIDHVLDVRQEIYFPLGTNTSEVERQVEVQTEQQVEVEVQTERQVD